MKTNYKILRIKNPVARKQHICDVCGKVIEKGERYQLATVVCDGKIHDNRRHTNCHNEIKVSADDDFHKEISLDTKKMLEVFSFEENMQIAFFPLVITEIAWYFTDKVLELAAAYRISETKKLSRAVKELRKAYISDCLKDLDRKHFDHMVFETGKFIKESEVDLSLLYYSSSNELKRTNAGLPYTDMRTYAYMALAMIDALSEHNKRMDKLIAERLGRDSRIKSSVLPKSIVALKECMEAYMSPASYVRIEHIKNSIAIILNKINKCEFVIN